MVVRVWLREITDGPLLGPSYLGKAASGNSAFSKHELAVHLELVDDADDDRPNWSLG